MPTVNGRKYSYDKKGVQKAMQALQDKKGYSKDVVHLAIQKARKK